MTFPDIRSFPARYPGPYERNMGSGIAGLLRLFAGHVPDPESNLQVTELATTPDRWSAGHAVFDEVRGRLLAAMVADDKARAGQYTFEESCCQAMYNAVNPSDPFDPGSPFFIAPQALGLARGVGVPVEAVVTVLAPHAVSSLIERAPRPLGPPPLIEIDAKSFTDGLNVEVGVLPYGGEGVHNAPPYGHQPNMVEYRIAVRFSGAEEASYRLEVLYAAEESRPVKVLCNGTVVSARALAATTGGWYVANQAWDVVGTVALRSGPNVLRISRDDYFPHLLKLRLTLLDDEGGAGRKRGDSG